MSLVSEEWFASTELVSGDLKSNFGRVPVCFPVAFSVGGLGQSSLVTERSTKSHLSESAFELFMVDHSVLAVNGIIRSLSFGFSLVSEVQDSTRVSDRLRVGRNLSSRVEWVRSSFKRICLAFGGIDRGDFSRSRVDGGNPKLSDDHATDGECTSLSSAMQY